jgi:hypothetical protein
MNEGRGLLWAGGARVQNYHWNRQLGGYRFACDSRMAPSGGYGGRLLLTGVWGHTFCTGIGADAGSVIARGERSVVGDGLGFAAVAQGRGHQPGVGADRRLDGIGHVGILAQECLGIFPALADALATIGEP